MTYRDNIIIFFLSLAVALSIASFQSTPGYLDADYYYATGLQLVEGKGFTEPFLWNYLSDPVALPHPSHSYWMPLTSIFSALGMWITRDIRFASAQIAFILLSAFLPLITAKLAFSFSKRRDLSIISAIFAMLGGGYAPSLYTTDSFVIYMVLGGLFFLSLRVERLWLRAIILGVLSALFHLTRADGTIWLIIALIALLMLDKLDNKKKSVLEIGSLRMRLPRPTPSMLLSIVLVLSSYALFILPWLFRNYGVFGTPLAPNGDQMLWLTSYEQIFSYPAGNLSINTWLSSGVIEIIKTRIWALKQNLAVIIVVQGGVVLLPFIIIGARYFFKKNSRSLQGVFSTDLAESSINKKIVLSIFFHQL
mgnify:FL=1